MAVRSVCLVSVLLSLYLLNCSDEVKQQVSIDTSCRPDNIHAEKDITIKEVYDGLDNNCNGFVDENYQCAPNSTRRCWPSHGGNINNFLKHPELGFGSALQGVCQYGEQVCRELENSSEWGVWNDGIDYIGGTADDVWLLGGCRRSTLPATEQCNNVDDNCDGRVDEGLKKSCWSGPADFQTGEPSSYLVFYNAAESSFTPCKLGINICQDGEWSGCLYEVLPSEELCDGVDNDCDGQVDDSPRGTNINCGLTDIGWCKYGKYVCETNPTGQADIVCKDAILPENEICNSIDDDCDGLTDEDVYRRCETICGTGIESCFWGQWQNCSAQQPVDEVCDGEDNDCDSLVDEDLLCTCPPEYIGLLTPCKRPSLVCGLGFSTCECETPECVTTIQTDCLAMCTFQNLPEQMSCDELVGLIEEEQCNNWDDDCDGLVDEDVNRECYTGPQRTLNVGLCRAGQQVCFEGRWGNTDDANNFIEDACANQILPAQEICDGEDNDCDGEIDEDINKHDKVDMVFLIDRSGSMCNKIQALRNGIAPYIAEFANTEHRFAIINIPGGPIQVEPNVLTDFVDAITFSNFLNRVDCLFGSTEPQYDAVFNVATRALQLSFRNDAWPMLVVMTDELAQSTMGVNANTIRQVITPCNIGLCTQNDTLEIYTIVPVALSNEWCAPANIAQRCYDLPENIRSDQITQYLNDIFSTVCR